MTIQLTNPSILDLTEWQKVINEITDLSSRIDQITTAQGSLNTSPIDFAATPSYSQQFNIGTNKILFGRDKADFAEGGLGTSGNFRTGSVSFAETAGVTVFAATPVITATTVTTKTTMPTSNPGISILVYNPTKNGFDYRLTNVGSTLPLTGFVYINWVAIGI